ncbi:MAG: hypothetical protein IJB48_05485 [Clostridia bacterium]|nr:hypothetical protein [Clostridia bacterium]
MAQSINHNVIAYANGTVLICALIKDLCGSIVTSDRLSSIKYSIYRLGEYGNNARTTVTGHTNRELTLENVFYDTVQQATFNGEQVKYNFRWTIDNTTAECFPNANARYLIRLDFFPVSGFISPVQITVDTI